MAKSWDFMSSKAEISKSTKNSLILNATLFEIFIFCPKIQFWQNPNIFTSFSSKNFLTIFLVKSKLSTAKKSKNTTFSRVFHPEKSTKVAIFGQKMKISNSVSLEGLQYWLALPEMRLTKMTTYWAAKTILDFVGLFFQSPLDEWWQ